MNNIHYRRILLGLLSVLFLGISSIPASANVLVIKADIHGFHTELKKSKELASSVVMQVLYKSQENEEENKTDKNPYPPFFIFLEEWPLLAFAENHTRHFYIPLHLRGNVSPVALYLIKNSFLI